FVSLPFPSSFFSFCSENRTDEMRSSASNLKQKSPVGRSRPSVSFEDEDDLFVSAKSTPSHSNPPSRPVVPELDSGKLPKRLYATDCYPPIGRINAYSKP
ncbi:unnamed protein product, partial [Arabidopsis halleri]